MRTIQIDDELYAYIVSHTEELGEGASPILRRLLGMPASNGHGAAALAPGSEAVGAPRTAEKSAAAARDRQLLELVASPEFRVSRNATQKFLALLAFLHRQDLAAFEERVLNIRGRSRKYFGRTKKELDDSGLRVHPRQIPGSPFWAMTNASTYHKGQMLREVLTVLGYGWDAALEATRSVR